MTGMALCLNGNAIAPIISAAMRNVFIRIYFLLVMSCLFLTSMSTQRRTLAWRSSGLQYGVSKRGNFFAKLHSDQKKSDLPAAVETLGYIQAPLPRRRHE